MEIVLLPTLRLPLSKKNYEILRFAQNDIDANIMLVPLTRISGTRIRSLRNSPSPARGEGCIFVPPHSVGEARWGLTTLVEVVNVVKLLRAM